MKNLFLSLSVCSTLLGTLPNNTLTFAAYPFPTDRQESSQDLPKTISEVQPVITLERSKKSTFAAVGLSYLCPGLGHVYLEDHKTAQGLLTSCGFGAYLSNPRSYASPWIKSASPTALMNTWFYGIYASYRDVRSYNGNEGYSYKMPSESFSDLAYAPFNISVLKKPEVWGGLLAKLTAAVGVSYLWQASGASIRCSSESISGYPLIALPVAIGEETMFRGYLQPVCSEYLTPWGGIAASSMLFGAAHIPNARSFHPEYRWKYYAFSLPLLTSAGAYYGWLAHKNCSLKETVAIHAWYDFILFSTSMLASKIDEESIAEPTSFEIAIPF